MNKINDGSITNEEQLIDINDKIIYDNLIKKYPWIVKENQKCILSPDSDGLLCGCPYFISC